MEGDEAGKRRDRDCQMRAGLAKPGSLSMKMRCWRAVADLADQLGGSELSPVGLFARRRKTEWASDRGWSLGFCLERFPDGEGSKWLSGRVLFGFKPRLRPQCGQVWGICWVKSYGGVDDSKDQRQGTPRRLVPCGEVENEELEQQHGVVKRASRRMMADNRPVLTAVHWQSGCAL